MQTVKKYQEVYIEGSLKMNMVWWFLKRLILAVICGGIAGAILMGIERANPELQCPVVVGTIIVIYVFFYEGKRRYK